MYVRRDAVIAHANQLLGGELVVAGRLHLLDEVGAHAVVAHAGCTARASVRFSPSRVISWTNSGVTP